MNPDTIILGVAWYAVFVVSLSFHEAAHSLAAMLLGDRTAYYGGQVSLHPFAHMAKSPFGMIIMPILSFCVNGWMLGWASAPYDPEWALYNPRRHALMALAGPAANLLLVAVAVIAIRVGTSMDYFYAPDSINVSCVTAAHAKGWASGVALIISILFSLNLILFVFNLFPMPPLDGSAAVHLLLDRQTSYRYTEFLSNPTFSIVGFIIAWRCFDFIFDPIHTFALNLIYPGVSYGL